MIKLPILVTELPTPVVEDIIGKATKQYIAEGYSNDEIEGFIAVLKNEKVHNLTEVAHPSFIRESIKKHTQI